MGRLVNFCLPLNGIGGLASHRRAGCISKEEHREGRFVRCRRARFPAHGSVLAVPLCGIVIVIRLVRVVENCHTGNGCTYFTGIGNFGELDVGR